MKSQQIDIEVEPLGEFLNVRFGSQADLNINITPTTAIGGKAAPGNADFAR